MAEPAAGPLRGAFNFRDLGGLRAGPGRVTRPGVLFRSDTLQALSPADVHHLVEELRLELVMDLRIGPEAVAQGRGPLAATPVCYLNVPLGEAPAVSDLPPDQQTLAFYLAHLDSDTSKVATAVRVACALAGSPVLVHCAAGKDRTGLVIALLLRLAGVDDDQIVADYTRTAAAMPRIMARFRGWPHYAAHMAAVAPEIYQVDERTITGFLDWLDRHPGGAAGWAHARGITDAELARLRAGLLVATPS